MELCCLRNNGLASIASRKREEARGWGSIPWCRPLSQAAASSVQHHSLSCPRHSAALNNCLLRPCLEAVLFCSRRLHSPSWQHLFLFGRPSDEMSPDSWKSVLTISYKRPRHHPEHGTAKSCFRFPNTLRRTCSREPKRAEPFAPGSEACKEFWWQEVTASPGHCSAYSTAVPAVPRGNHLLIDHASPALKLLLVLLLNCPHLYSIVNYWALFEGLGGITLHIPTKETKPLSIMQLDLEIPSLVKN